MHVALCPRISSALSGLSRVLGGYLTACATWIWCTVAEDGPQWETETRRLLPEVLDGYLLAAGVVPPMLSGLSARAEGAKGMEVEWHLGGQGVLWWMGGKSVRPPAAPLGLECFMF